MKSKLIELNTIVEHDGILSVGEMKRDIPFEIQRVFYIYNVPSKNIVRANHASVNTDFFIHTVVGSVCIELFDGKNTTKFKLDKINKGVYVSKLTWIRVMDFSENAVLQVYANNTYEKCEYIKDINEYKKYILD